MKEAKSIFVKDVMCPICNIRGSLQILSVTTLNSNRIRHYLKLNENKKPVFEYHRVSKEYVEKILSNIKTNPDPNVKVNADQTDQSIATHDLNLKDSSLKPKENYSFSTALEMRSKAFFMFSMELAKDKRR
jgi:hypothetical protein